MNQITSIHRAFSIEDQIDALIASVKRTALESMSLSGADFFQHGEEIMKAHGDLLQHGGGLKTAVKNLMSIIKPMPETDFDILMKLATQGPDSSNEPVALNPKPSSASDSAIIDLRKPRRAARGGKKMRAEAEYFQAKRPNGVCYAYREGDHVLLCAGSVLTVEEETNLSGTYEKSWRSAVTKCKRDAKGNLILQEDIKVNGFAEAASIVCGMNRSAVLWVNAKGEHPVPRFGMREKKPVIEKWIENRYGAMTHVAKRRYLAGRTHVLTPAPSSLEFREGYVTFRVSDEQIKWLEAGEKGVVACILDDGVVVLEPSFISRVKCPGSSTVGISLKQDGGNRTVFARVGQYEFKLSLEDFP